MKKYKPFFVLLMACLLFAGSVVIPAQSLAVSKMPKFSLESVRDGRKVSSEIFSGKVLLVIFFATWCPPCAEEVPVLNNLQAKLSGAGFSVVGLSVDQQGPAIVAEFMDKKEISYPVLMAEQRTTMDFGGVYGIPVSFLVSKEGNVVKKYMGYVQAEVLEKDIESLLN